tara:strand:- start:1184 stop:1825 length:642 start_codon:yes stop_codon:yes gene_type:complete
MDRDSRRISNEKQGKIKTSNQIPTATEGQDGDMVMVNGQLYIKSNNTWSSYSSAESSASSKPVFKAGAASGWEMNVVSDTFIDIEFGRINIDTHSTYDIATFTYRIPPGMGGIYYVCVKIVLKYNSAYGGLNKQAVLLLKHNRANGSAQGYQESWAVPQEFHSRFHTLTNSSLFLADDGDTLKSQVKINDASGTDMSDVIFDDKSEFFGFKIN